LQAQRPPSLSLTGVLAVLFSRFHGVDRRLLCIQWRHIGPSITGAIWELLPARLYAERAWQAKQYRQCDAVCDDEFDSYTLCVHGERAAASAIQSDAALGRHATLHQPDRRQSILCGKIGDSGVAASDMIGRRRRLLPANMNASTISCVLV